MANEEKKNENTALGCAVAEIAASRGIGSLEELADRVGEVTGGDTSVDDLTGRDGSGPRMGFGHVLEETLGGLSEAEVDRIVEAFGETMRGRIAIKEETGPRHEGTEDV